MEHLHLVESPQTHCLFVGRDCIAPRRDAIASYSKTPTIHFLNK